MNQYFVGRKARRDLRVVWRYVARDQVAHADALIDSLYDRFRSIAMNPEVGQARSDIKKGLRILSVGKYVVGFRRVSGGISIVRVIHGARDWESMF